MLLIWVFTIKFDDFIKDFGISSLQTSQGLYLAPENSCQPYSNSLTNLANFNTHTYISSLVHTSHTTLILPVKCQLQPYSVVPTVIILLWVEGSIPALPFSIPSFIISSPWTAASVLSTGTLYIWIRTPIFQGADSCEEPALTAGASFFRLVTLHMVINNFSMTEQGFSEQIGRFYANTSLHTSYSAG